MENIISDYPCRSCLNERDDHYDGFLGLSMACVHGHCPKSFAMYGASNQVDGERICSDYLHDEKAWW